MSDTVVQHSLCISPSQHLISSWATLQCMRVRDEQVMWLSIRVAVRKQEDSAREQWGFEPHHKIVVRETTKCEVCITLLMWALDSAITWYKTIGMVDTTITWQLYPATQITWNETPVHTWMRDCLAVLKNTWRTLTFSKETASVSNSKHRFSPVDCTLLLNFVS